jgi:prepilin-type N-terminal cleavage/methylation domain-containing protein
MIIKLGYDGKKRHAARKQAGFTIIELLIATLVFALVLVIITISVLTFTKTYFRGVNQAATQTAARTIVESIAQAIQFSGNAVNPQITPNPNGSNGFCIGNQRYSYILYWQLVDGTPDVTLNQSKHALVKDSSSSCAGATAQDMRSGGIVGTELLPPNMRLAKLRIEQVGDPTVWKVTIRVVYGDNDLLCSPAVAGDCSSPVTTSPIDKSDLSCKVAFSGSQYCAASELSTIVKKRVTAAE